MADNRKVKVAGSGSQAYVDALRKLGADKQTIKDAEDAAERAAKRKSRQLAVAGK